MILVDTNVLGRLCHADDPLRPFSMNALRWSRRQHDSLVVFPQTLYEFWVIATRPADVNGLEMSFDRALRWMQHFQAVFAVLRDPPELLERWKDLLRVHQTLGKRAHDARLVAAMQMHGVDSILTFNVADFTRYGVKTLDPRSVPPTAAKE